MHTKRLEMKMTLPKTVLKELKSRSSWLGVRLDETINKALRAFYCHCVRADQIALYKLEGKCTMTEFLVDVDTALWDKFTMLANSLPYQSKDVVGDLVISANLFWLNHKSMTSRELEG